MNEFKAHSTHLRADNGTHFKLQDDKDVEGGKRLVVSFTNGVYNVLKAPDTASIVLMLEDIAEDIQQARAALEKVT